MDQVGDAEPRKRACEEARIIRDLTVERLRGAQQKLVLVLPVSTRLSGLFQFHPDGSQGLAVSMFSI